MNTYIENLENESMAIFSKSVGSRKLKTTHSNPKTVNHFYKLIRYQLMAQGYFGAAKSLKNVKYGVKK